MEKRETLILNGKEIDFIDTHFNENKLDEGKGYKMQFLKFLNSYKLEFPETNICKDMTNMNLRLIRKHIGIYGSMPFNKVLSHFLRTQRPTFEHEYNKQFYRQDGAEGSGKSTIDKTEAEFIKLLSTHRHKNKVHFAITPSLDDSYRPIHDNFGNILGLTRIHNQAIRVSVEDVELMDLVDGDISRYKNYKSQRENLNTEKFSKEDVVDFLIKTRIERDNLKSKLKKEKQSNRVKLDLMRCNYNKARNAMIKIKEQLDK